MDMVDKRKLDRRGEPNGQKGGGWRRWIRGNWMNK